MFDTRIDELDADGTLSYVARMRRLADRAEVAILVAAAHYADLYGHLHDDPADGSSLPGMERLVGLGGEGTPEVAEFAPAELGAELAMSPYAAAGLIGDALDLRHRLPTSWSRVLAGEVRPWIGRKLAAATRQLPAEVVAAVDAKMAPRAHSLSWGRLQAIVDAAIVEADPQSAAERTRRAETDQGVWLNSSNDHGIKDIYIRTEAPHAIWFDASIDRIADGLAVLGDPDSVQIRRARAVGVIAQPQRVLDLFQQAAAAHRAADGEPAGQDRWVGGDDCADPVGAGSPPPTTPGSMGVDSRPPATLYVHVAADCVTRGEDGVARFEGVGPITVEQATRFLGHCQVTVKPVIDLAAMAPVDAYEVPDRLREATFVRNPIDVFPYATNPGRRKDIDHTDPYVDTDDGGPPGQTRLDNLAPMTRFHHRVKTHGRWHVVQPFNGLFVWRSPHGRHYLVDHTGTHQITTTAASDAA